EAVVESGVLINQDESWHKKNTPNADGETNDHPNLAENQSDGKGEEVFSVEATNYEQAINMTGIFSLPTLDIDPDIFASNSKWGARWELSGPSLFGGKSDSAAGMG